MMTSCSVIAVYYKKTTVLYIGSLCSVDFVTMYEMYTQYTGDVHKHQWSPGRHGVSLEGMGSVIIRKEPDWAGPHHFCGLESVAMVTCN